MRNVVVERLYLKNFYRYAIIAAVFLIVSLATLFVATRYAGAASSILGDINGDGQVTLYDLSVLLSNYNAATNIYTKGDLNASGKIDSVDLAIVRQYYGKVVPSTSSAATAKLRWAPPGYPNYTGYTVINPDTISGRINMDKTKDYIIKMPNKVRGPVWLYGGRNVVLIGGSISSVGTNADVNLYLDNVGAKDGTVHIEGLSIDILGAPIGDAISGTVGGNLQIENVRITGVNGGLPETRHGDIVQVWGSLDPTANLNVRIDRLTGTGSGQGFIMRPEKNVRYTMINGKNTMQYIDVNGNVTPTLANAAKKYIRSIDISNVDLYHNNIEQDPAALPRNGDDLLFMSDTTADPVNCRTADKITFTNVYFGRLKTGTTLGRSVYPGDSNENASCRATVGKNAKGEQTVGWVGNHGLIATGGTGSAVVSGVATFANPPNGEFVKAGTVGLNYVSPGYQ
jgi:Dockerin type I domain